MKKAALALALCLVAGVAIWALWPEPTVEVKPVATGAEPKLPVSRSVDQLLSQAPPALTMADAGAISLSGTVSDAEGQPIAGAEVLVFPQSGAPSVIAAVCDECGEPLLQCNSVDTGAQVAEAVRHARGEAVPLAATRTDAEGHYLLPIQWDGELVVRAVDGRARQGWQTFSSSGEDETVDLTLAERTRVQGQVHDEANQPVAGARVLLLATSDGAHVEATSDGNGNFEVLCPSEPCALWTYTEAPGFAPLVLSVGSIEPDEPLSLELMKARDLEVQTRLAGKPIDATLIVTIDSHKKVLVARGGVARIENLGIWEVNVQASANGYTSGDRAVSLSQPHNKVVFDLRASARALVEVLGPDGNPLADASVSLDAPDVHVDGQSGDDGALVVLGPVGEGAYQLQVTGPEGRLKAQEVDLVPGDNTFTVTLPAPQYISGRVLDADGKPAPASVVVASATDAMERATSDAETGAFQIAVSQAGPWQLVTDSPQQGRATLKVTAPAHDVVLKFERHAGITVQVTAEGAPGRDVMVAVMPEQLLSARGRRTRLLMEMEGGVDGRSIPQVRPMSGVTDEDGRLVVWGLEPGAVQVRVEDAAFRPAIKKVTLIDGRMTEVQVTLERGATIEGLVVDAQGRAVSGSDVTVALAHDKDSEGTVARAVEEEGVFKVAGLDPGKSYVLSAQTEESLSPEITVQAPAHGVRLVLAPMPRVKGRVIDEAGAPVAHFEVEGKMFDARDGRFDIPANGRPDLAFFIVAEGFKSKMVEMPGPGDAGDITLERAPELSGHVVNARGEPVSGALVSAEFGAEVTTGTEGAFELHLDEITYPMVVRASRGAATGLTEVKGPGEVVVKLGPKTHVDGRSYDYEGRPAPGAVTARLTTGNAPMERLEADGQGRFAAELPQGVWEFESLSGSFSRTVPVMGERVEVALGGLPGTCSFWVITSAGPPRVYLQPKNGDGTAIWIRNGPSGELAVAGLPCGSYTLNVISESSAQVRRFDVELKPPVTRFELPPEGAQAATPAAPGPDQGE